MERKEERSMEREIERERTRERRDQSQRESERKKARAKGRNETKHSCAKHKNTIKNRGKQKVVAEGCRKTKLKASSKTEPSEKKTSEPPRSTLHQNTHTFLTHVHLPRVVRGPLHFALLLQFVEDVHQW